MNNSNAIAIAIIFFTMVIAYMGRYDFDSTGGYHSIGDRWTGTYWTCELRQCVKIFPPSSSPVLLKPISN